MPQEPWEKCATQLYTAGPGKNVMATFMRRTIYRRNNEGHRIEIDTGDSSDYGAPHAICSISA